MSKNIFTRLIIKVSKKLVHKLYYAGVFDIVSGKKIVTIKVKYSLEIIVI